MNIRFEEDARDDIRIAVRYYKSQHADLGDRFLKELIDASGRILAHPHAWSPYIMKTRVCQMHVFPFGLVYRVSGEVATVFAVADLRRKPGYWKRRIS